jgi:homoserine kinase type II
MAVYTKVSLKEANVLVRQLGLGDVTALRGIQGGIENTNYFATTTHGDYVLTLFERLSFEQLPYYLHLMQHLAQRGIPVPDPVGIAEGSKAGQILHTLKKKPASVVTKLRGKSELAPGVAHCAAVGDMLARMHLAGRDFGMAQPNLRGLAWWNETAPVVMPHLDPAQAELLRSELAFQNHIAASSAYAALPQGAIHADLFRDNVMFDSADGSPKLSGFFDFYFAGLDAWLFDIAVCLNDWCIDLPSGVHDAARSDAFVAAYQAVRPLTAAERQLLPALLRAGALRFWISRLWDFYLPREASMLKAHDPSHFERVLIERIRHPVTV